MTTTIEGCHHLFPCADPLTHARKIAELPEPLPVGTPKHREWQDARNRVATAALATLAQRDEKRAAAAVERISSTTPDSRIAHDWHLDALLPPGVPTRAQAGHLVDQITPQLRAEMEAYWASAEPIDTSTTATPDTSTTAGKISVMAAYDRGDACQWRPKPDRGHDIDWQPIGQQPQWNWCNTDYRIAPPPVARTALQRARAIAQTATYARHHGPGEELGDLVCEVSESPLVMVTMNHPTHDQPYPHICQWIDGDVQPGRYRLLRDDE